MRLDVFLNTCCLVKHRSEAKRACDNGIVQVDGQVAKAGRVLRPGQRVRIDFADRLLEIEVVDLPARRVSKKDAPTYYRVIRDDVQASEFF